LIQIADSILNVFGAPVGSYRINVNSRSEMVKVMESFGMDEAELKAIYKLVDKMAKIDAETFHNLLYEHLSQEKAARLIEFLKGDQPPQRISDLLDLLKKSGVDSAVYESSVVRGLEYYTDIVFEVFDTNPQNPRAMFGGGRYDGLVGLFGVEPVPTVGFGMGDVTLQNFLVTHGLLPQLPTETDLAVLMIGDVYARAQELLAKLRDSGVNIAVDSSGRKLDSQIKHAVKSGVRYALFIGESELSAGKYKLRDLEKGHEEELDLKAISNKFAKH
jgi:histidyl-tRNA synthetase